MTTPPEGEVEGPLEPVPGGQPSTPPQPVVPAPGTYNSRNAGRRASLLQGLSAVITDAKLQQEIGGIRDEINNVGEVVEDYGPQITDLIENRVLPWAVPTIAPLSQTINRRADPTFQLSDFMLPTVDLTGQVATATTQHDGTSDSHTHGRGTLAVTTRIGRGGAVKGVAYFAFITPAITREYEQLNFMLGEGTTTPANLDVAVYLVDPDTRVMSRQVHVTNAAAGLPLSESVVTVQFPKWVAVQGSYIAVAFLWHGTGDTRHVLGIGEVQRPLPTEIIFPAKISAVHTNTSLSGLPTTVDGTTQVNFNTWFTPYAELSEKIGTVIRAFKENWPDVGSSLSRPWVALTSQGIGSYGGYTAAGGSGVRVSMYDTPLATDRNRVATTLYRDSSSGNVRRSTLIVRGTNNLTSGIGLSAISRTRYELIAWTNKSVTSSEEWDDRTVLAVISRVPTEGDWIEVDYIDGLVSVRIAGGTYVSDLAVAGFAGSAYRFVGIQNRRQSFITSSWSPFFGPWTARDLPQSSGDGDDETED